MGDNMRIDYVNGPDVQGKTPAQAIAILVESCHAAAVQIMRLNNDLEDLKEQVEELTRRVR
jgi:hypothetical protein